jgi:MarR family transcriptional regulator, lower aerobic nicotinate degradation pathway regulator
MVIAHDLAVALRAAYLAMHRRADAHLSPAGVTADQFVLLSLLAEVDGDGVTQQQLVRAASSDPSTVRAILVLLEERGLVARRRHATDGRARSVTLTPKGRRKYEKLWTVSAPVRSGLLAALGPDEAPALLASLRRIADAMSPATGRAAVMDDANPIAPPKGAGHTRSTEEALS